MRPTYTTGALIRTTSVIVLVACGFACNPPDGVKPLRGRPAPDAKYPLPPGVNPDAEGFRAQISTFRAGPTHRRNRDAECIYKCSVDVIIGPIGDTYRINPDSGPAVGTPVVHMVNIGPHKESYYKLKRATQAEYYLWVDRKPGGVKARWTLLEVPAHGAVLAAPPTDLNICHRYRPPAPPVSDADFTQYRTPPICTEPIASLPMKMSTASLSPFAPLEAIVARVRSLILPATASAEGGWIDCSMGCCT